VSSFFDLVRIAKETLQEKRRPLGRPACGILHGTAPARKPGETPEAEASTRTCEKPTLVPHRNPLLILQCKKNPII
jgi:hypothetical protein